MRAETTVRVDFLEAAWRVNAYGGGAFGCEGVLLVTRDNPFCGQILSRDAHVPRPKWIGVATIVSTSFVSPMLARIAGEM